MWRAVVVGIIVLFGARGAGAAPAPWTFDATPEWTNITHEPDVEAVVSKARQPIVDGGGTFDAALYRNDTGTVLFIVTSDVASMTTLDAREAMEAGAAKRGRQDATERAYREDRSPTVFRVTQRVTIQGTQAVTRRVEGFLKSGALRVISINCYGDDATCDPLIDRVSVDESAYRALADVKRSDSSRAYRIGTIVGSIFGVLLVGMVINAIRRRFA